jgi:hypothetical protein
LADARERHRVALSQRHDGENPVVERRRERQESLTAPTVRELADMLPISAANAFFSVTAAVITIAPFPLAG